MTVNRPRILNAMPDNPEALREFEDLVALALVNAVEQDVARRQQPEPAEERPRIRRRLQVVR